MTVICLTAGLTVVEHELEEDVGHDLVPPTRGRLLLLTHGGPQHLTCPHHHTDRIGPGLTLGQPLQRGQQQLVALLTTKPGLEAGQTVPGGQAELKLMSLPGDHKHLQNEQGHQLNLHLGKLAEPGRLDCQEIYTKSGGEEGEQSPGLIPLSRRHLYSAAVQQCSECKSARDADLAEQESDPKLGRVETVQLGLQWQHRLHQHA